MEVMSVSAMNLSDLPQTLLVANVCTHLTSAAQISRLFTASRMYLKAYEDAAHALRKRRELPHCQEESPSQLLERLKVLMH